MPEHTLLDIDDARRRPDGDRVLVYLDQSSLSRMVREQRFGGLRELLCDGVRSGRLICPRSPEHEDESRLARADTWEELDRLGHQMSPGVHFLTTAQVENNEIRAAARALLGRPPEELWREAFTADPHTARAHTMRVYGGEISLRAVLPPTDDDRGDVNYEKGKEAVLTEAYRTTRERFSFEEICDADLHVLLEWKLGPLASTSKFMADFEDRSRKIDEELARGEDPMRPGSAFRKLQTLQRRAEFITRLCREMPELTERSAEFFVSRELRTLPGLLLYAYLRAGLAATPGRTGKPGDGYDINHLVRGLSRCDIVTADRGMVEMVRARGLLPAGCQLFESSDVDGLLQAIDAAMAA